MVTRKILFAILAIAIPVTALAALTSSSVPSHNHSSTAQGGSTLSLTGALSAASVATSGTVSSTKACASGYTRIGPNFCLRTTNQSGTSIGTTCTNLNLNSSWGVPSDAKSVLVEWSYTISSGTVAGNGQIAGDFYSNTPGTCTTAINAGRFAAGGYTADTAGGQLFAQGRPQAHLPFTGACAYNGCSVLRSTNSFPSGGSSTLFLFVHGYFD